MPLVFFDPKMVVNIKVCGALCGVWAHFLTASLHLTLEWYMARLVVKNGYNQDMFYNTFGLCAKNIHMTLGFGS